MSEYDPFSLLSFVSFPHAFCFSCQEGICTIKDGKTEETFQIVRENEYLVVLRTGPGAIFTGDFPHAGVRNFPVGSEENKLMTKLYQAIEAIRQEGEENDIEHNEMTTGIIKMLCRFKNLDKLCRFHCSTEPLSGPLRIPRNSVGFVDCRPNPPEDMCVDMDRNGGEV